MQKLLLIPDIAYLAHVTELSKIPDQFKTQPLKF